MPALRRLRQESHIYKREVERAEKTGDNISRSTAHPEVLKLGDPLSKELEMGVLVATS